MSINSAKDASYHSKILRDGCVSIEGHLEGKIAEFIKYLDGIEGYTITGFPESEKKANDHLLAIKSLYRSNNIAEMSSECWKLVGIIDNVGKEILQSSFSKLSCKG